MLYDTNKPTAPVFILILKMEAVQSSETFVYTYQTTQYHIPVHTMDLHHDNLEFHINQAYEVYIMCINIMNAVRKKKVHCIVSILRYKFL